MAGWRARLAHAARGGVRLTAPACDFDAAVVGGGAVGLACALALCRRGLAVVVLEKEAAIGHGVSSRNSEVIHAGLYYPSGSLRARLCIEGRRALYDFLAAHHIAHHRRGKLVVATSEDELDRLAAVLVQARANGVEGVRGLDGEEARRLEPRLSAVAAILSEETGVFDAAGYMLALQGAIEAAGGVIALQSPFLAAAPLGGGGFRLTTGGEHPTTLTTRRLVLAAGLGAQAVAAAVEGYPAGAIPPRRLGKGSFFRLAGAAPFQRLIYPLPIPGALGVHHRLDVWGQTVFGPDLSYVDEEDYQVDEAQAGLFYRRIRRFWPALPDGALIPDYAGIRPKIHGPGEPQPDFRLDGPASHGVEGLLAMFGIESPGLTASLAIGGEVLARLGLDG